MKEGLLVLLAQQIAPNINLCPPKSKAELGLSFMLSTLLRTTTLFDTCRFALIVLSGLAGTDLTLLFFAEQTQNPIMDLP